MNEKEKELDVLITRLTGGAVGDESGEYPLPEKEPIKYTNVDVLILPRGYKGYPTQNEDARPRFVDAIPKLKIALDDAKENNGVFSVPVTIASAKHVYNYDGLKVHKPFEELEAIAHCADNRPITREHPTAGIVTDRREVLGFFRSPVAIDETLRGILEITDKDLIADVKGKILTEVSAGFYCDLDRTGQGETASGKVYDAVQKNIFLDHVAIVENGRCSYEDGCGINMTDEIKREIEEKKDEFLDAVKGLKEDHERVTKELIADRDEIISERDELKTKLQDVVNDERKAIIDTLVSLQNSKTKEELGKLELDALVKELDMVKELKGKRLTVPDSRGESRSVIDDAYAKIGGR